LQRLRIKPWEGIRQSCASCLEQRCTDRTGIGAGTTVGEMALLEMVQRSTTVIADSDSGRPFDPRPGRGTGKAAFFATDKLADTAPHRCTSALPKDLRMGWVKSGRLEEVIQFKGGSRR